MAIYFPARWQQPIKPSSLIILLIYLSSLLLASSSSSHSHSPTPTPTPSPSSSSSSSSGQNSPIMCYDHLSPINRSHKTPVECPMTESSSLDDLSGLQTNSKNSSKNMVVVQFTCGVKNSTLCTKVKNTFEYAGIIISSTLSLNTEIIVNASFLDFCETYGKCGGSGLVMLGGAAPARTIPLQDDDGLVRLYPQSLVKQFRFKNHPEFNSFDITATFNSAGANYWFRGDPIISPDQQDFLYVVLHELVHGLGFCSGWQDYINEVPEALTPDISVSSTTNSSTLTFNGFLESAFDKYMVILPTGQRTSALTGELNQFANNGAKFANIQEFYMNFKSSDQYRLALEMMNNSTTPFTLGFLPIGGTKSSDCIILETSLNPYQQGSSVSHVNFQTYNSTCDFLMMYLANRGQNMSSLVASHGNYNSPIGPELLLFFNTLGYASPGYPNPYKPNATITTNKFNPNVSKNVEPGLSKVNTVSTATVTVTATSDSTPIIIPMYTAVLFGLFSFFFFNGIIICSLTD